MIKTNLWNESNIYRALIENKSLYNYKIMPVDHLKYLSEDDNYEKKGILNEKRRKNQLSYCEMLWKKSPYRRRRQYNKATINT